MIPVDAYHKGIVDWIESECGESASSVEKGDAFCRWCLENVFDLSSDQALDAMDASGQKDHGIDAFILGEDYIRVIQAKYESSHSWSEITKFHYDMRRILSEKAKERELNQKAQRVVADILDAYAMDWRIEFFYVTSSQFTEVDKSKLETIEKGPGIFTFLDAAGIAEILETKQQALPDRVRDKWFELRLASREILKFAEKTAVIAVSLADMHDFVEKGGNELFASNVRQYLNNSKINRGIRQTIQETPENFWLYNNGITLVCDDFEEKGFSLQVKTPQIVNGCQTAKSIAEILGKKREEARKATAGYVLVRIIKGANIPERENITRYTNSQNAVRGKDFFSLEDFHKILQKKLQSAGYYYEIQRGAYTSLKPSEKAKYGGVSDLQYLVGARFKNVIPALEAIQAFASGFKNLPGVAMSRPNELTPIGPHYDTVFSVELQPDPKLFLYPFLVREWARDYGYSRGGQGGWRAYAAWFFVRAYYVLCMRLLKEAKLVDQLEESPEKVEMLLWDKIFLAEGLNTDLLKLADDLLERYFADSKVDEAVGQDVRKLLRSQELLDKHASILDHYANTIVASPRNRQVVDRFISTTAS